MKVLVHDQLIEYKDEGSGSVVVLLHGWGTNLGTFDQLASRLAQQFRVIRFDFPGFGQSPKPTDDWHVREYAQLTRDLLQKLKIDDTHAIIAHSFGGRVVIKGVSQGYLKPEKVVLIGAAGVKPHQSATKNFYKGLAKAGKLVTSVPGLNKIQPMLRKRLYSAAGSTDYLEANAMQKIFLNTINEDLLPLVHAIAQPALLIWGENDVETPVADARKMINELPDGKLIVVPNAGHFVYLDDPLSVQRSLEAFL
jgi:pimeloyl-ACP methyl ester carboxylesterase